MKTIMLTETYQQAAAHANELGLNPRDWIFPNEHSLFGFKADDLEVVYCPTFYTRKDWPLISERLRIIGLPPEKWKRVD
jgi:hypothetical protein